jgi:hypothetical protein
MDFRGVENEVDFVLKLIAGAILFAGIVIGAVVSALFMG